MGLPGRAGGTRRWALSIVAGGIRCIFGKPLTLSRGKELSI
jgi:hypothetical protein